MSQRLDELWVRLMVDVRFQYACILVVGGAVLTLIALLGGLPLGEMMEGFAALVFLPPVIHRIRRSLPSTGWRPQTLEGKVDQVVWRLGMEGEGDPSAVVRSFGGDFLDDPDRLETYLPPSFEPICRSAHSEAWGSDELRAVLHRDGLRLRLEVAADEMSYTGLRERAANRALPK